MYPGSESTLNSRSELALNPYIESAMNPETKFALNPGTESAMNTESSWYSVVDSAFDSYHQLLGLILKFEEFSRVYDMDMVNCGKSMWKKQTQKH